MSSSTSWGVGDGGGMSCWMSCLVVVLFIHQIMFVFQMLLADISVHGKPVLYCLLYCKHGQTTKMSQATTGSRTRWQCVVGEEDSKTDYSSLILWLKYTLGMSANFRSFGNVLKEEYVTVVKSNRLTILTDAVSHSNPGPKWTSTTVVKLGQGQNYSLMPVVQEVQHIQLL